MKQYIKKIVRYFSEKPIIGRLLRILSAIVRLPQIRDIVFETSQQVTDINHRIDGISGQVMEIDRKINEINHQLETLNKHQHLFNTEYLPNLLESLDYQKNLKKSLPVVLRQHQRSIINQGN